MSDAAAAMEPPPALQTTCGAKTKSGKPCQRVAGAGTEHLGIGACWYHFGRVESHQKHAAKVIAEAKRQELTDRLVDRLGEAPRISTGDAMQVSLSAMAETLAWFRDDVLPIVGTVDESGRATPMLEAMLRQVAELRDTARHAGALGIEERRIAIEEGQLAIAAQIVAAALAHFGLDVSTDEVRTVVAAKARALDVASVDVPSVDVPSDTGER